MVFGRSGSGKTTFAIKLSKILNIPVFHVDKYFFTDGWEKQELEVFMQWQRSVVAQPSWIIEGNAMRSLDVRYKEADIAICFYLPWWVCLWRIIKRRFKRRNVGDRAKNCPERISWDLVIYMFFYKRRLQKLQVLKQKHPATKVMFVQSDKEASCLLRDVEKMRK